MGYDKELEIVQRVTALKQEAVNARTQLEQDFQTYWDMYNGKLSGEDTYPWRSKIFMNETFKAIDTIHPIFMDMLFMRGNPFRIKGVDGDVDDTQAKVIESLIRVLIEKMDAYNTVDDIIKDLLIYGTSFAKVGWEKCSIDYEKDEPYEEDEEFSILGMKYKHKVKKYRKVPKSKITKDQPRIDRIDYKDIFFGTRVTDIQKGAVIHRAWRTLASLMNEDETYQKAFGEPLYKNLDKLSVYAAGSKDGDQQDNITSSQNSKIGIQEGTDSVQFLEMNESGEIEILEYWTSDNSHVYTVAGGLCLIREAQNPYDHKLKPFIAVNYIRRPGTLWGIGVCELCEHGQALLNTSVNQGIDSNNLANNLMLIADRESNIDLDQVKTKPGGVIWVDKEPGEALMSKVQQFKFAKIDTGSEVALAIREIQESSGASKMMQGTYESGAVRNTSQTRMIMSAGGKRFAGKVLTFEEMFLKPFIRQMYGLIQQFLDQEVIINVIGEVDGAKYVKISKLDIARDLDFIPVGSRQLVEMEQIVHQMNNYLAVVSGIPYAPAIVNFRYLLKKIWNNMSPDHDGDQVVLSDKDAKRAFQEMQQLAQMGGASKIMEQGAGKQAGMGGINASQPNMAGGVQ